MPIPHSLEIDLRALRYRAFEVLPGLLSWGTLAGLTLLAFLLPFWIAIFVIVYDVYVLIRAVYMSVHLIYAYRRLNRYQTINWLEQCRYAAGHLPWEAVHHFIVLPTYNEPIEVLKSSLQG